MTAGPGRPWTRRKVLAWGLGGIGSLLGVGGAGIELVLHDVVPGHQALNQLDGNCSVAGPRRVLSVLGPLRSGQFSSVARNRTVGYTIAYPPGHGPGSELPLVIALHGFGNDHTRVLSGLSPQQALALQVDGQPLAAMAVVAVDGGDGYWHAIPSAPASWRWRRRSRRGRLWTSPGGVTPIRSSRPSNRRRFASLPNIWLARPPAERPP